MNGNKYGFKLSPRPRFNPSYWKIRRKIRRPYKSVSPASQNHYGIRGTTKQDTFAIDFAEWYEKDVLAKGDYEMIDKDKKELLEIFKETYEQQ